MNPHKRSRGDGATGRQRGARALGPGGHSPRPGCCAARGRLPNPGVVERAGIPPSRPLSFPLHPRKRFPGRAEVHLGDSSHGHCILNCDCTKLKLGSATERSGLGLRAKPPAPCTVPASRSPHTGAQEEGREGRAEAGAAAGCLCCRWEGEPAPAAGAWAASASRCLLRDRAPRRRALVLPSSRLRATKPGQGSEMPPARWSTRLLPPRQTHEDRAGREKPPGSAPRWRPPPPSPARSLGVPPTPWRGPDAAGAKGDGVERASLPSPDPPLPTPPPTWGRLSAKPGRRPPPRPLSALPPPAAPPPGTHGRGREDWETRGGRGASRSQVVPGVSPGQDRGNTAPRLVYTLH